MEGYLDLLNDSLSDNTTNQEEMIQDVIEGASVIHQNPLNTFSESFIANNQDILHHHDPLSCSKQFKMEPFNIHHVKPHFVEGYYKSTGEYVDGYYRGGPDGYYRSNPDDILENNLSYEEE